MWKVLLPYLLGAASAFGVQYLIEIYVVPRVETRKRREERWEKDVLDLGELLSGAVQELAQKALSAQRMVYTATSRQWISGNEPDELRGYLLDLREDSFQATREFTDLVLVRADWIADRIIEFRPNSGSVSEFTVASVRYRLKVLGIERTKYGEASKSDFEAFWDAEHAMRAELLSQVKALARLRHPPRASLRRQIQYALRTIEAKMKRKPMPPKPSKVAAKDTEAAIALRTRKGTASPWHQ